jgi:hypothetical protein
MRANPRETQVRQRPEALLPWAKPLVCIECRRAWTYASKRWRLLLTDDDPREAVPYCQHCFEREFGPG